MRGQPIQLASPIELERALDCEENSAGKVDLPLLRLAPELVGIEPALKGWGLEVELTTFRERKPSLFLWEWSDEGCSLGPGLASDEPPR